MSDYFTQYVIKLINELFNYDASVIKRKQNAVIVLISGVNFTEMLQKFGLKIGNKVRNQVDILPWIKEDKKLSIFLY